VGNQNAFAGVWHSSHTDPVTLNDVILAVYLGDGDSRHAISGDRISGSDDGSADGVRSRVEHENAFLLIRNRGGSRGICADEVTLFQVLGARRIFEDLNAVHRIAGDHVPCTNGCSSYLVLNCVEEHAMASVCERSVACGSNADVVAFDDIVYGARRGDLYSI